MPISMLPAMAKFSTQSQFFFSFSQMKTPMAAAAAAAAAGVCGFGIPIDVVLDGGTLQITVSPDMMVTMTGPAEKVYDGEMEL